MNKCPDCNSENIDTYSMPNGAIWCNDCGYRVEDKENCNPFYTTEEPITVSDTASIFKGEEDTKLEKFDMWIYDHIPHWLYRAPFRVKDFYHEVRYFLQKVFRLNHTSDKELWNLSSYIIKFIYPKLKLFISMRRMGYPSIFSDYDEHSGFLNKEDYDKYIASGEMLGGGEKAWELILNEMLFACEYVRHDDDENKFKTFYKDWKLEDPREEKIENLSKSFLDGEPFYYNTKLEMKYGERAQKGLELLGKHMLSLWD